VSRSPPILQTDRLMLRLPEAADVAAIVRYYTLNTGHFAATDPARPVEFLTSAFWHQQVRTARREFAEDKSLRLLMFRRDAVAKAAAPEVLGTVNFSQIVRGPLQACYLGYGLDAGAEGQGYMTEGLREAVRYVFDVLKLHRIMANHLPENQRSAAVLQRLGFEVDGLARDYLLIGGRWRDHVLNSLVHRQPSADWAAAAD
jgi:ribosomal-protein-alanine N-acetyltransferase